MRTRRRWSTISSSPSPRPRRRATASSKPAIHDNGYPRPAYVAENGEGRDAEGCSRARPQHRILAFNLTNRVDNKDVRVACRWRSTATRSSRSYFSAPAVKAKTLDPTTIGRSTTRSSTSPTTPRSGRPAARAPASRRRSTSTCGISRLQRPYNPNGKRIGEMMQADSPRSASTPKLVTFEWASTASACRTPKTTPARWLDGRQRRPGQFLLPARLP